MLKSMIAGVALIGMGATASAQQVSLAVPTTSLTFSSLYIAELGGFFEREGLTVDVRQLVGVASVNALIGGSIDFTVPTATTMLRAGSAGQHLVAIANIIDRPMVELVMRKDVAEAAGITDSSTVEQRGAALKGKTVAIQGVGSIIDVYVRAVARMGGLDPDKDVTLSPMGPPAMYPALKAKQIDAYATSLPWTTQSVLGGEAVTLFSGPKGDLPEYLPFAYIVLATRAGYCEENAETCRKMARAFAGAAKLVRDEPDKALALVKKKFDKMDPALLEAAWKLTSQAHAADAKVPEDGLLNAQKFDIASGLLKEGEAVKDVSRYYTNEYLN
jgi:ABC-type nitrate/sulfonate/bicarbonate transport system substrate-binding protein